MDVYARSFGEVFSVTWVAAEDGAEEAVGVAGVSAVQAAAALADSVAVSAVAEVSVVEELAVVGKQYYRT